VGRREASLVGRADAVLGVERAMTPDGDAERGILASGPDDDLAERIDSLATWLHELDGKVRAIPVASDSKQLKELTKALEAWSKHDPKLEDRVTNRIDVLADRFATLAGTVNTTATALAGKDGDIANLRRELHEGQARLEAVVRELRQSGSAAEIAELRKAVAALSTERKSRSSDGRVDALSGEVDVLAQRLDTLSKTVSTTAAGLAGKEGDLAALRSRLEEGNARVESVVGELRRSLETLSAHVTDTRSTPRDTRAVALLGHRLEDLGGKVDELTVRLDTISTSVDTASAGLSENEHELAALHRSFDEASSRVDAMVIELREAIATLPEPGTVDPVVEGRLQGVSQQIERLSEHLFELEAAATARSEEEATFARAELDSLLAGIAQRLADIERDRDAAAAEFTRSSEAWAEERAWVRGQLESLAAAVEDSRQEDDLEPKLQELSARLEAMERSHESVGGEIERVSTAFGAAQNELQGQLDSLTKAMSAHQALDSASAESDKTELVLTELANRLESMEREATAVAAEIARADANWSTEFGSLEARLDEVANGARETVPVPHPATEQRLEELARRLDEVMSSAREAVPATDPRTEQRLEALAQRLDEVMSSAREAVPATDPLAERRIAELALRLQAVEREREQTQSSSPAEAKELSDLRVLINGLRMRQASSEKELAALAGSGDISARLDDLNVRLASLERSGVGVVPVSAPVPGDGRFRVELRGLELRMEHLEAAARENRDAVLMQFERLASRLQWRLQQLETENESAAYTRAASGGKLGQVVPIRGEG